MKQFGKLVGHRSIVINPKKKKKNNNNNGYILFINFTKEGAKKAKQTHNTLFGWPSIHCYQFKYRLARGSNEFQHLKPKHFNHGPV